MNTSFVKWIEISLWSAGPCCLAAVCKDARTSKDKCNQAAHNINHLHIDKDYPKVTTLKSFLRPLPFSLRLSHTQTHGERQAVDLVLPGEPGSPRFCAPDVSWTTRGLPGSWRTNSARQPWCVCVCVCPRFISAHVFLCFLEASNAGQLHQHVCDIRKDLFQTHPSQQYKTFSSLTAQAGESKL